MEIYNRSIKKKGGQNIKDGRLNRLISRRNNVNKNNPKIINKLKDLSLSLEQKYLASPKVFGKHDNKIYKKMYEDLQKIIKMKSSKNKAEYFLSNEIRKRINKSIEKWTVKKRNCETRRCKKQRVASKLMEKEIANLLSSVLRKKKFYKNKSKTDIIFFRPEWNIKVNIDNNLNLNPYEISNYCELGENALNVKKSIIKYCFSNNYVLLNYLIFGYKKKRKRKLSTL